jgi:hypothetical protein
MVLPGGRVRQPITWATFSDLLLKNGFWLITYFTIITNSWYTEGMKRATITLPDDLEDALEAYRRSQEVPLALTAVTQAALREYLERRGFLSPSAGREFVITPAEKGSGSNDVSVEHDRYFAEAAGEKAK